MVLPTPTKYFDFVRVEMSDGLWFDVQRLRYDVYCEELQFLDPTRYPDKLETDAFDEFSMHFAGVDHEKQAVATLRLVHDSHLGFPVESHATSLFPDFYAMPRHQTVEISRLILAGRYRRRANDGRYGTSVGPDKGGDRPGARPRSPYPLILFGLFRLMFEESVRSGLQWWLAAMEPWLQIFLSRFGFVFKPVGHPIEYYGQVVPYAARIEEIFRTVSKMKPEVLNAIMGDNPGNQAVPITRR
jgi:N-acyl amino acid synthase of PEP-CTERM/exosortase system